MEDEPNDKPLAILETEDEEKIITSENQEVSKDQMLTSTLTRTLIKTPLNKGLENLYLSVSVSWWVFVS